MKSPYRYHFLQNKHLNSRSTSSNLGPSHPQLTTSAPRWVATVDWPGDLPFIFQGHNGEHTTTISRLMERSGVASDQMISNESDHNCFGGYRAPVYLGADCISSLVGKCSPTCGKRRSMDDPIPNLFSFLEQSAY